MIYFGLETENPSEISVGNIEIKEVYAGEDKVWPPKPRFVNGLDSNDVDYVDMGEAGIWASCNIGASKPEEYGQYFAWGDTKGYYRDESHEFSGRTYRFGLTYTGVVEGYTLTSVNKYNQVEGRGTVDNLIILEPEDDAAHINLGGDWRVPTANDFHKLIQLCNVTLESKNGIDGTWFTLLEDETKKIFIPFSRLRGASDNYINNAYVWTSNYSTYMGIEGLTLTRGIDTMDVSSIAYRKSYGACIRPILAKPVDTTKYVTVSAKCVGEGKLIQEVAGGNVVYKDTVQFRALPGYIADGSSYSRGGIRIWSNIPPTNINVSGDCKYTINGETIVISEANSNVDITFYF